MSLCTNQNAVLLLKFSALHSYFPAVSISAAALALGHYKRVTWGKQHMWKVAFNSRLHQWAKRRHKAETGRCTFRFVLMKGEVAPEEKSRKCPCQACVIFKVSTDGSWDVLLFIGSKLNRGAILCCIVPEHSPEQFSQCSLFITQKWNWQENFPSAPPPSALCT